MKLSIIIVNYNTKDFLYRTLSAIYPSVSRRISRQVSGSASGRDFETIVVDNASMDGSVPMLSGFPQVSLIKNAKNVGFAKAANQAIPSAQGEYILFLNPDATPEPSAIERMIRFMELRDKNTDNDVCATKIGCVGPKLLYPDGSLQLSCRSFPTYVSVFWGRPSLMRKLFPDNPFSKKYLLTDVDHDKIQKVDWVIGACMLTKREILEKIGYFDEDFFIFVEDLDFCYRLRREGFDIYYFPPAVFYHQLGASANKYWLKSIVSHNLGMYKFFKKHYRLPLILRGIVVLGLILRIFFIISVSGAVKQLRR